MDYGLFIAGQQRMDKNADAMAQVRAKYPQESEEQQQTIVCLTWLIRGIRWMMFNHTSH